LTVTGFIWLQDVVEKLWQKHTVHPREAEQVFSNTAQFRFVERGYREGEDVYSALGQSLGGRYLIVFFVYKQDRRALVVSAREMTTTERRRYERK
jgi:uncharacterized DUF497 family protein